MMIHADWFAFKVTDKTSVSSMAGEITSDMKDGRVEEVLVAFIAVESGDEKGSSGVSTQAAEQIKATAEKIAADRVMVYPYAHLSSDLSKPRIATAVLDKVTELLRADQSLEVFRAPFGYYKSYEISCKGHPLSELSMTLTPETADKEKGKNKDEIPESKALEAEKTIRSEWRIYQPDGGYVSTDDFDFSTDRGLKDLFSYEREGTRVVDEAPTHIKVMREQELVDYEPASDSGNLRWYPKGLLVKRLLEQHVTQMAVKYGAMEVETPIMYDYGHPALCKYLQRFPARQYVVKSEDKEYFLRFAACFGQYMIKHDMFTSYRNLPVCLYELTHYSFRREQRGELAGLRRLRSFTMPDMHTLVKDVPMVKDEFIKQISLCLNWLDDIGLECVPVIRFVRSFADENPEFIANIMKVIGRPTLVEIWDQRFFYFVAKFEMNFVDTSKKAACLSTVQIDVENAERFDIEYVDEDGTKKRPLLMHTSISGSVDRNVYAILEKQVMRMAKGQKAALPTWLSPIQVRVLPISEKHLERAVELADRIPFRVEVDDRNLKIGKKVRESEKEWIPFALIVGDNEMSGERITVRPRVGEQFETTVQEFIEKLSQETAGKPQLPSNTPKLLSRRPIFVG